MAHLIEILTALMLGSGILGGGIKAVHGFTKSADSVEHRLETIGDHLAVLAASMERVVSQIGNHEMRITRIEDRAAALHDDVRAGRTGQDASPV